jgi:hypothetical protein
LSVPTINSSKKNNESIINKMIILLDLEIAIAGAYLRVPTARLSWRFNHDSDVFRVGFGIWPDRRQRVSGQKMGRGKEGQGVVDEETMSKGR